MKTLINIIILHIKLWVLKLLKIDTESIIKHLCIEANNKFKTGFEKRNYVLNKFDKIQEYIPQASILNSLKSSRTYINLINKYLENSVRGIKDGR